MFAFTSSIHPVDAIGTITIKADGSVDPPTAPISRDGNVYTLTADISSDGMYGITIERDNVILDGADHTLSATGSAGIDLVDRGNVTIKNVIIKKLYGTFIQLSRSSNNSIICNNMTGDMTSGIILYESSNNSILGNKIAHSNSAIYIGYSSNNNSVVDNTILSNEHGISLTYSSNNNKIYHNNFVNNWRHQAYIYNVTGATNVWDDGYPNGGNYWSDYQAIYPLASEIDSSGIWNTPYTIYEGDIIDHYPLMKQVIIPEFQSPIILLLLMGATTVVIIAFGRHKMHSRNKLTQYS